MGHYQGITRRGRNATLQRGMVYLIIIMIAPNDPQIHLTFEWDLTKAEIYLEKKRKETNLPLTLTHLVGFCAARGLSGQPDLNGRLSFGNVNSFIIL